MSIKIEVKHRLTICYFGLFRFRHEQILDMLLHKKKATEYPHDLVNVPFKFHLLFNYSDYAVCDYGSVYLNAHSCFRITPESCDVKMLFNPFKEKLHLSPILIEKYNLLCCEIEIVGVECECSVQFWNESDYVAYWAWIVGCIPFSSKSNCLVAQGVSSVVKYVFSRLHNVSWPVLFTDDEERINLLYMKETGQIPVSTVKNISCQRFIINSSQSINIMHSRLCDLYERWNLRNNIQLSVEFYSKLCASELGPTVDAHTKINGRRVERIKFSSYTKLFANTCALRKINHMIDRQILQTHASHDVCCIGTGMFLSIGSLPKPRWNGFFA